jgi:uroporphyrin-3 C-methyltransferase
MTANDEKNAQAGDAAADAGPSEASADAPTQAETPAQQAEPAPADESGRGARPRSGAAWFAVLLALVAAGIAAGAWFDARKRIDAATETLAQRVQALEGQQGRLRALAQEAQQSTQALQGKLSTLEVRVADAQAQRAAIEALYQELSRNRNEWRVAEVEQMVDIAVQQLDLAGNARGALLALQLAESRLARSDDAAFAPLRTALARDIEALKALPAFDPGALGKRIERLAVSVEGLPMAFDERTARATPSGGEAARAGDAWYARLWAEVWREIRQLIVVRRVESPEPPLLAPAQSYFLRENLRLRLLSARLALLTRDASAYRDDLQVAQAWIKRYFDTRSARTAEVLTQLEELAAAPLRLELPSIAGSVNAVRALGARGGRGS